MDKQQNASEGRSFSRVSTFTNARYRKLSQPDEPQIYTSSLDVEADSAKRVLRDAGLPDALVAFLASMDAKLDRIISQMNKESLASYFPEQLVVLDLSAAGLLVQSDNISPGDTLELVLFLGEFPPKPVSGVAEVLRSGKEVPGGGKTYALKFTRLREADREEIVRFVFKENRVRIRAEKFK